MAKRKANTKPAAKPFDQSWENNPDYPEKRDICFTCEQRDDVKLSYDKMRYICKNSHACLLRFAKLCQDRKK